MTETVYEYTNYVYILYHYVLYYYIIYFNIFYNYIISCIILHMFICYVFLFYFYTQWWQHFITFIHFTVYFALSVSEEVYTFEFYTPLNAFTRIYPVSPLLNIEFISNSLLQAMVQ